MENEKYAIRKAISQPTLTSHRLTNTLFWLLAAAPLQLLPLLRNSICWI